MKRNPVFYLFIILLFSSCFSIKPATTKTGKNLWEEFFVSPGVIQYFIKPLAFQHNDDLFEVDFTFRNGSDSVTVNFTLEEQNNIISPDQIYFLTNKDSVRISSIQTLLNAKSNDKFKLRKTGKISFVEFKQMLSKDKWVVTLLIGSATKKYSPTSKTIRHLQILKNNLFVTIE
ncbi:MAG: hypothetical protein Q8R96_10910 [Bacteroidota bacterium]|nr:hypothetical protein [Bacteroidota bacterium]